MFCSVVAIIPFDALLKLVSINEIGVVEKKHICCIHSIALESAKLQINSNQKIKERLYCIVIMLDKYTKYFKQRMLFIEIFKK